LTASHNLGEVLDGAEVVVMAVPSHGYRAVLATGAGAIDDDTPVLSLTKGIEQDTLMRMTEVTADVLAGHDPDRIGVLTGPNLAAEIVAGQPTATVIAMADQGVAVQLQELFGGLMFRVYTNADVVGAETAGATKNVMAIAAGMAEGLGFGLNTRATLLTRALAEMTRLGVAMGGHTATFAGLAGMGDLIATCMSPQSRNHRVGFSLGQGKSVDEITAEMSMVAEGIKSTAGILALAERNGIEMPIADQVGRVLYDGVPVQEAILALMGRTARSEVD
jgi:glycerol-3-phosphate dehydrogenase (NAD(P)+)